MAKDFLGNEIHVGDKVFYARSSYRTMHRSVETVLKITDKSVWLKGMFSDYKYIPADKLVVVTSLVNEE